MDTHFDVLILGTGLVQSIVAAALAKARVKVLHVDTNAYYGGAEASMAQDELIQWCQHGTNVVSNADPLASARTYALSLSPALIPSSGHLINALIQSGVARYTQFKLLDAIFVCNSLVSSTNAPGEWDELTTTKSSKPSEQLYRVPCTKEDIFRTRAISLVAKRKLMRFLQFAASDFHLKSDEELQPFGEYLRIKFAIDDDNMRTSILYALALCATEKDPTLPALCRLRTVIQSAGRYGNSPFLIGHYGGLGEIAQGFCRTCAVHGGVYVLGRRILSLTFPTEASLASISLEDVPDFTAEIVLCDASYLPMTEPSAQNDGTLQVASAILVLNTPLSFPHSESSTSLAGSLTSTDSIDIRTATIIIPLSTDASERTIRLLHMGDETLSSPRGKFIVYAWTSFPTSEGEQVPKALLEPYISQLIPSSYVEFSCYYLRPDHSEMPLRIPPYPRTLISPPLPSSWSETGDKAASEATRIFEEIMRLRGENDAREMWPPLENAEDNDDTAW